MYGVIYRREHRAYQIVESTFLSFSNLTKIPCPNPNQTASAECENTSSLSLRQNFEKQKLATARAGSVRRGHFTSLSRIYLSRIVEKVPKNLSSYAPDQDEGNKQQCN